MDSGRGHSERTAPLRDFEREHYNNAELNNRLGELARGNYNIAELNNRLEELARGNYDIKELSRYYKERSILIGNIGSLDNLLVYVREEQNALALSRLPTVEETFRLSKTAAEEIGAGRGSIASIHQEALQRLVEGISTPWVDKSNAQSSFESAALLSSVGNILHGDPFDSATSKALRSHLGDWSQTSLPRRIFSDYRARESFFRDHGFDHRLTIIPEPAFTDLLDETGISHPALLPTGSTSHGGNQNRKSLRTMNIWSGNVI